MPTNILSADNATFETSLGDWIAPTGSRVTTPTPHAGSGVLAAPLDIPSDMDAELPLGIIPQIPAGHIVSVTVWQRQAGSGTPLLGIVVGVTGLGNVINTSSAVPTTSWLKQGGAFISDGGIGTISINLFGQGSGSPGDIGYASDVFAGHEAVNPPSGLSVTDSAGDAELNWTDGAVQYLDFFPSGVSVPVRNLCKISVERSDNGGAYAEVHTQAASTTTWTDTGVTPGVAYAYRVRYAIYGNPSFTGSVRGYSAYSNVDTFGVTGGWGVGMVRMGAN